MAQKQSSWDWNTGHIQKSKSFATEFCVSDNNFFVKDFTWAITQCYPNWFKHPFKDESTYFKRGRPFQNPNKNVNDLKACELARKEEEKKNRFAEPK
jgi:hypothetical protein